MSYDQAEVINYARAYGEWLRLKGAGLLGVDADQFVPLTSPPHPDVLAWLAIPKPTTELRRRAILLHMLGQAIQEARTKRLSGTEQSLLHLAVDAHLLPLEDVTRLLAYFDYCEDDMVISLH